MRRTLWLCAALLSVGLVRADEAPALQVTTLTGKSFDLATHRGQWVIVNWWATFCVPCIKEMPEISAWVAQRGSKVAAVGLAFEDSDRADILAFLKQRPVPYPVAQVDPFDPPKDFAAPSALPTTVVIAPDGHVARTFVGPITAKDLDGIVTQK